MSGSKKVLTIGSVLKRKEEQGGGTYIKIKTNITLKEGEFVNVDDPRTLPDRLLEAGVISDERHAEMKERAEKTPDFVVADLTVRR